MNRTIGRRETGGIGAQRLTHSGQLEPAVPALAKYVSAGQHTHQPEHRVGVRAHVGGDLVGV
ncbi:MAG: hypothetical protein ACXWZI_06820 [Mycobacterium sp.]